MQKRRSRSVGQPDDGGATMILVLLVTTLCMIYVSASLAGTTGGIRPARATADSMAALAAAQAGVDILTVTVEKCGAVALGCSAISGTTAVAIAPADGSASRATYRWKIVETPDQNLAKVLRMEVTGQVRDSTRTLVADYETIGTVLDYAMFTDIETVSPQAIALTGGPRTVQLPDTAIRAKADKVKPQTQTSVTWTGSTNTDICKARWFDTPAYGTGRANLRATRGITGGNDYTDVTLPPSGVAAIGLAAPCEIPYGSGFVTSGAPDFAEVYSRDSMLLSNRASGGPGPRFAGDVVTEWSPTSSPPGPQSPGKWYRSNATFGGDPESGYQSPSPSTSPLALPTPVAGLDTNATCIFTGPTRIQLSATATTTTATVTSPGTASLPASCTTAGSDPTLDGAGLKKVPIPITKDTIFYVKDGSTIAPARGDTNPLFFLQKLTATPIQPNQPGRFYSEMGVNEALARSYISPVPRTEDLKVTLDNLFAQLNNSIADRIGGPFYQTTGTTVYSSPIPSVDGLLEPVKMSIGITRKACTRMSGTTCVAWDTPTNEFTYSRELYSFPLAKDVTPYQTGTGTAFVEGAITGALTIVAARNIVLTEDTTYTNANSLLGLVAGYGSLPSMDVEVYHPVGCVAATPATLPGGTCPNDITGLYSTALQNLGTANPLEQYTDLMATDLKNFVMSATVLTPTGAFSVQNPSRGLAQNVVTVIGAVYEHYRGQMALYYGAAASQHSGYSMTLQYDATLKTRQPPQFSTTTITPGATVWQLDGVAEKQ